MRVRYTPRAFADREAIFEYLEARSPNGAQAVKRAMENSIRRLEDFHTRREPPTSRVYVN